ncbi:Tkl/drk protein kinase, partial [Globisporangium splendens]
MRATFSFACFCVAESTVSGVPAGETVEGEALVHRHDNENAVENGRASTRAGRRGRMLESCNDNLVVKVADFGLSRYKSKLYGEYTFVGTPFWAAPEVIRHENYDEKADVYSYAIVLWELVERKDPYESLNAFQVPLLVANDGLRPAEFTNAAPLGLDQLMKQCWDADPGQRPTFAELAETLQKWLRPDEEHNDLSMHIQREQNTATEEELHFFASPHDTNEKAIPIFLSSRMQSKRSLIRKPSFKKSGSDRSIQE